MNSPATIVPMRRRFDISAGTIVASPSMREVTHHRTCRTISRIIRKSARDDIRAVLDALGIDRAHIVGLSMGAFAALHFGFEYPARARSLVVAGRGYGAAP